LTATSVSGSRIDLAWNHASAHETNFRIERSNDAGSTFTEIGTVAANVHAYSDTTGLTDGTSYVYRVRAANAATTSAYSSQKTASTKLNAPSGLTATTISNGITLVWTDLSQSETGYKVERSSNGGSTFTQIQTVAANVTTYSNVSGITEGNTYVYRVRATNALGNSLYSNQISIFYLRAPSNLQVTVDTATRLKVAWTDHSSVESGFKVERSTDGAVFTQIGTTTTAKTYTDATVTPGVPYWYRVRAHNASGNSSYSNVGTGILATPAAPTGLTATPVSSTSARLDWTDASFNEAGFKIERSTNGTSYTQIATVGVNVTTYTANSLTAGTLYYFRVRAHNPVGNSAYSNVATTGSTLPNVSINATDATASEPADTGTFTITRTGSTSSPLTVNYTVSGSATSGADYTALSGTVTIPAGVSSVTIVVTPQDNTVPEGSETVVLTLSSSASYNVVSASASVTIVDNDQAPSGPLVAAGATWKYLDNGTDQGTAWRQTGFNDSAWQTGVAQFGFGESDQQTVLATGRITYYFRKAFNVTDPSAFSALMLRLLRDDGAVVYLNGNEVYRSNMPTGTITYQTLASSTVGGADETTFFETSLNPNLLVSGTNVIAVELHQVTAGSSDMSFDLELLGS
jgi:titin